MKQKMIVLLLGTTLLFGGMVHAQEATPEPTPAPVVTPAPVSDLTNTLLNDIETFLGTYAAIVGAAVAFVVGLAKKLSFLDGVDARIINIVVSAVFVVGLLLATNFGYGDTAKVVIDALPKIGTILLGLLAAFGGSTAVHEAAHAYNIGVFGSKRSATTQTASRHAQ